MEKTYKLTITERQLNLISNCLEFYCRIGIGQFDRIKDHPTFTSILYEEFAKKGELEVGDKTNRGEVVEIDKKGKWIKTKGSWGKGEEIRKWTDVENVKHSTNYSRYHEVRTNVDMILTQPRNMLLQDLTISTYGSFGLYHEKVHESCREAFDIERDISKVTRGLTSKPYASNNHTPLKLEEQ